MDKYGDSTGTTREKLNHAIASMCDEWLLIEEIDLENDSFEILHDNLYRHGIPVPRNCSYSEQNLEIQELIEPGYQEYRYTFCDRRNLSRILKQSDTAESAQEKMYGAEMYSRWQSGRRMNLKL